jgi:hypothetical protein
MMVAPSVVPSLALAPRPWAPGSGPDEPPIAGAPEGSSREIAVLSWRGWCRRGRRSPGQRSGGPALNDNQAPSQLPPGPMVAHRCLGAGRCPRLAKVVSGRAPPPVVVADPMPGWALRACHGAFGHVGAQG